MGRLVAFSAEEERDITQNSEIADPLLGIWGVEDVVDNVYGALRELVSNDGGEDGGFEAVQRAGGVEARVRGGLGAAVGCRFD